MRRLVPGPEDEDLDDLYAELLLPGTERTPAVSLGMVASVDGAATFGGRTAGLGGPADRSAFRALREACDVILVGAGTVRAEGYGPPPTNPERQARRRDRGLAPVPRIAVVTRTLDLDPRHRLFSDPQRRPLVITHERAPEERERLVGGAAEVLRIGTDHVDLPGVVAHLGAVGLGRVLCEGGPTLNASLLEEDLVDEVFLTLAPLLVGGDAPRIASGLRELEDRPVDLVELREHEHELVARYRRRWTPGQNGTVQ